MVIENLELALAGGRSFLKTLRARTPRRNKREFFLRFLVAQR